MSPHLRAGRGRSIESRRTSWRAALRTQRSIHRIAAAGATFAIVFAACSPGLTASPTTAPSPSAAPSASAPASSASSGTAAASGGSLDALVAAAKQEGSLNVIALPHDWCHYGTLIDNFKSKYGLAVNEINPNGGSGDEIQAIVANENSKGPQAPDVIDIAVGFVPQAMSRNLLGPYKVSTWDSIDPNQKDPNGYWYGDYYGILSFEVNTDVIKKVPQDWKDLLKPEYKNSVALVGDPTVANQAIESVYASALANGGSLDNAQPGLDFFKQLAQSGNLMPTIAKEGTLASGETPIVITWSYIALVDRDALKGNPNVQVVVPVSGRFGDLHVQAISANAPHPNAAELWEEYLYSDEGQLGWVQGYCYTSRYADLKQRNVIPSDLLAKLPDVTGAVFPSSDQLAKARTLITGRWMAVVGVSIK